MNASFLVPIYVYICLQVSALDLIGKLSRTRSNAACTVTRFINDFVKGFPRLHCKDGIYVDNIDEDPRLDIKEASTAAMESSRAGHSGDCSAVVWENNSISSRRWSKANTGARSPSSTEDCEQVCLNPVAPVVMAENEEDTGKLTVYEPGCDISSEEASNTRDLNVEGDWQIPLPSIRHHKATSCSDLFRNQRPQPGVDDASVSTTVLEERLEVTTEDVNLPMVRERAGHKILKFFRTAPWRAKLKALLKVCIFLDPAAPIFQITNNQVYFFPRHIAAPRSCCAFE